MRVLVSLLALFVATVAPSPSSAQASTEEIKGFWQKGDVTNWRGTVKENSSSTVVYHDYPMAIDKAKQQTEQEVQQLKEMAQKAKSGQNTQNTGQNRSFSQPQEQPQTPPQPEQPMTREQIIAKYGSPDQISPIRAQKDAPVEMQGLFAALNSGDKELAWQYSVALARRNTEIQSVVSKATDYQLLAMESLGIRPKEAIDESSEAVNPTRLELKEFMERTRNQELKRKLDIDQTLKEQGIQIEAGLEKAQAEAALGPQIPVDPEGKVKVLIFFDEKDESVKTLTKNLEPLKESFKSDPNTSFIGLTKRSYALPALKMLSAVTSFPFPLLNGEALAQELRIQSYPTILFLAVTTKQTYRLEGEKTAEEIGKVVRLMKGQK